MKIFQVMSFLLLLEFGVDYLENNLNSHPYFANAYLFVFLLIGMHFEVRFMSEWWLKEKKHVW